MAAIASLLELPTTSKGFSTLTFSVSKHGSSSGRLQKTATGPFIIQIEGDTIKNKSKSANEVADVQCKVRRWIRSILATSDEQKVPLPSNEEVYSACRTLVTVHGEGSDLYNAVQEELTRALQSLQKRLTGYVEQENGSWLAYLSSHCAWFESNIVESCLKYTTNDANVVLKALMQSLLTYLDRIYVANNKPTCLSIHDLAYDLFAAHIFGNVRIIDRLRGGISNWLQNERDTQQPSKYREHVTELIKYIMVHKHYPAFEEYYIDVTGKYYLDKGELLAEQKKDDPKGLFGALESLIGQEAQRSKDVLPVGSWGIVLEKTEEALLHNRTKALANSLTPLLLDSKDFDTLHALYSRLTRVKALSHLAQSVKAYIEGKTKSIVTDNARDDDMVERLLSLRHTADTVLSKSFTVHVPPTAASTSTTETKLDQTFAYAISDAFNLGFRARRNKPAEMIAKYLDKQLRKGQKGAADAVFQAKLSEVLPLYRYTEDKDVFRTFYHRMLAKRLLLGKSASIDIEKWLLKELEDHYDHEFGNAEPMFKDLHLSKEMMEAYHRRADTAENRKLNVMVLQQSVWPFSRPQGEIDLPPDMQNQLTAFTEFYKKQHSGRALHWDHALGTVTLRAGFKEGTKELSVSLHQAVVLLLFNSEDEIPFRDIAQQTRIEDGQLRRTLQSLACAKKRVLKKVPPGKDVNDGDVFRFNHDFTDPLIRVHINTIQAKVSAEESRRTNVSIEADRVNSLEAAIVRIMKAKKELLYEQLKVATIDAVKNHFVPNVELIKKCIDSLVDRDYLERSEEDKSLFKYVA